MNGMTPHSNYIYTVQVKIKFPLYIHSTLRNVHYGRGGEGRGEKGEGRGRGTYGDFDQGGGDSIEGKVSPPSLPP